jgi:endoglucanase
VRDLSSSGLRAAVVALLAVNGLGVGFGLAREEPDHPAPRLAPAATADHGGSAPAPVAPAVQSAADRFLDGYVAPDGRVVRRDQGDDTVSEGQAYAMLVAVGVGHRATFDQVWHWTREHLQRDDGLLSWRWAEGEVRDPQPAADADLDAAWALAVAARRWPEGGYGDAARSLAEAIDRLETTTIADRRVLLAGPWAAHVPEAGGAVVVNPSYASPVADAVLAAGDVATGATTEARRTGNRSVVADLMAERATPTDWAWVAPSGDVQPADAPTRSGGGAFGWDAIRVPLQLAASCDPADRQLAAELWPAMVFGAGVDRMGDHPARLVGAAAAAAAHGDDQRSASLLAEALRQDEDHPSYYGAALNALGALLLRSDALGGCPLLAVSAPAG